LNIPTGQPVHAVLPAEEYLPMAQEAHAEKPVLACRVALDLTPPFCLTMESTSRQPHDPLWPYCADVTKMSPPPERVKAEPSSPDHDLATPL